VSFSFSSFVSFSPYSRYWSVNFSFYMFSIFFPIFQVQKCVYLTFHVVQFSRHIPGLAVCVFHFSRFSVFICQSPSPRVCVSILPRFSVFSPHSRSYTVHFFFIFSHFSVFLAIFQVISCLCLIFYLFKFSRHIPSPTACVSNFPRFSVFSQYNRA